MPLNNMDLLERHLKTRYLNTSLGNGYIKDIEIYGNMYCTIFVFDSDFILTNQTHIKKLAEQIAKYFGINKIEFVLDDGIGVVNLSR